MMGRRVGGRDLWIRVYNRFVVGPHNGRPFCTNNKLPKNNKSSGSGDKKVKVVEEEDGSLSHYDAYRDLDKLDFMTAAKILFTTPPKPKKFGLDFHLVQLFFVCMPSLAVYLVAQYARSEMRRMDAELEKRKQAEEAKAKEMEQKAAEERAASDPQLLEVKVRLEKLEETVKEFVVESKKQSVNMISENQEAKKEQPAKIASGDKGKRLESSNSAVEGHQNEQKSNERVSGSNQQGADQSAVVTGPPKDQKSSPDVNPSQVEKK